MSQRTNRIKSILLFWTIGLLLELLLIGHFGNWLQLLPLILIALYAIFSIASLGIVLKVICLTMVAVGIIGVLVHFNSNMEFERELYPDINGWKLFTESLTGAMPVLAPGALVPIGLIGLIINKKTNNKPS